MAPKKILLLGATGEAGIATIQYALSSTRDVEILVYARSPAKIPEELRADSRVRILPGGELSDTAALRDAVAQKPDAIVSLLGPPPSEIGKWMNPWGAGKELVFANTYRVIVDAMKEFGVRRILVMGTISIEDEKDKSSFGRSLMVWVVWAVIHNAWRNIIAVRDYFDTIKREDGIDWTIFRLGGVLNGDFQAVTDGYVGDGNTTLSVRRSELAQWLVEQAVKDEPEWVCEKPMVSSASKQKV